MEYITTASVTVLATVLFLIIYKYVINPTVVYTVSVNDMSQCPDAWNYNSKTKKCEPGYKTHCLPFSPGVSTLSTTTARCNLARSCGTTWSGYCA